MDLEGRIQALENELRGLKALVGQSNPQVLSNKNFDGDIYVDGYVTVSGQKSTLASVYLGTSQTGLTSGTTPKVVLDTELYDLGNNFAANKYVAPVTGYYQINFSVYMTGDGGALIGGLACLFKDGVPVAYGNLNAPYANLIISVGSALLYAVKGSYFELFANADTSSSTWKILASIPGTFMTIALVATA